MGSRIFTYLGFFVLLVAIPCPATTWTVDDNGPADFASIQDAIDHSQTGDTIEVQPGIYHENITYGGKNIVLKSTNPNDPTVIENTIIDGGGLSSVVTFKGYEDERAVLTGFTLTGGNGNSSGRGGAINGRGDGQDMARPIISDCIIRNNIARYGTIGFCSGFIKRCIIVNNVGQEGGGFSFCGGVIANCLIAGNKGNNGGGFYACDGLIFNCTITENKASNKGGGIYLGRGLIANCILWNNESSLNNEIYGSWPIFSCIGEDTKGTGCINADPLFVNNGNWDDNGTPENLDDDIWVEGDYQLSAGSPCVDSGRYSYYKLIAPDTDLVGNVRLVNQQIDLGCYEYGGIKDTDGDWLADQFEESWDCQIGNPDSDNDDILDGIEFLTGAIPTNFDSLMNWYVPMDCYSIQQAIFFCEEWRTSHCLAWRL
jgi:hypothetical protein